MVAPCAWHQPPEWRVQATGVTLQQLKGFRAFGHHLRMHAATFHELQLHLHTAQFGRVEAHGKLLLTRLDGARHTHIQLFCHMALKPA